MYDVAIIGSGPAGISAAVNLKLLNKNFIWFSGHPVSKKVARAELIHNYLGLPSVTGSELAWAMKNHYESMNLEPRREIVTGVYDTGGKFSLTVGTEIYDARAVILCLGVETTKPVQGEEDFLGRGVSYCATCDGFLYKDKTIGIYCTDKQFEHEVEYLITLAKKAYIFPMYNGYEIKGENAEIILKQPKKFTGTKKIEKVEFTGGFKEIDGMFILRPSVSPTTLVHGLQVDAGHIAVDRSLQTNIKGIFAAGDCTGRPYQYAKAVGEGNVAAHSAVEYLAK